MIHMYRIKTTFIYIYILYTYTLHTYVLYTIAITYYILNVLIYIYIYKIYKTHWLKGVEGEVCECSLLPQRHNLAYLVQN